MWNVWMAERVARADVGAMVPATCCLLHTLSEEFLPGLSLRYIVGWGR